MQLPTPTAAMSGFKYALHRGISAVLSPPLGVALDVLAALPEEWRRIGQWRA